MNKHAYIGMSADPPHIGHVKLVDRVKQLGFDPIIVLNSNEFIKVYKGREPFSSESNRYDYFRKHFPTAVIMFVDKDEQRSLIESVSPDVIVVGSDWMRPEILPQLGIDERFVESHGIGMLFLPRTPGISSTEIRKKRGAKK